MEGPPAESCVRLAKHYIENWKPISELLDATPVSVNLPVCLLSTWTVVLISATAAACYLSSAFHIGCKRKTNWKKDFWVVFSFEVAYIHLISDFRRKKNKFFFFHKENIHVCISLVVFVVERRKKLQKWEILLVITILVGNQTFVGIENRRNNGLLWSSISGPLKALLWLQSRWRSKSTVCISRGHTDPCCIYRDGNLW